MGYYNGTPNGKIYLGKVKWDNEYKNVVNFASKSARNTFFTSNFNLVSTNFIYANRNEYIDIDGTINGLDSVNYCFFFCDEDIAYDEYICCFVTSFEFISPRTTRLHIEVDVFQTYFYDTTFYNSFIERAHIPKSLDSVGYNTLPEPINYSADYKKEITIFNNVDWTVQWVAQTLSNTSSSATKYTYGGNGYNDEFSGTYAFSLGSGGSSAVKVLLDRYYKDDEVNDHRSDIINVIACPKWVLEPNATSLDSNGYLTKNSFINADDTLQINNLTLACGYTPKNKKLLTSLCRVIIFYNRNGFKQAFKPELFTTNNPAIRISKRVLNSSSYKLFINNYRGLDENYFSVPYNASVNISYNENVGTQQLLKTLNGYGGLISGVGGAAVSAVSGNYGSAIQSLINTSVESYVNIKSAYEQVTANIGTATEVSAVIPSNIKMRCLDCSPLYQECEEMDRYFDLYGYNISEVNSPYSYMTNRSQWNYIKTSSINLTVACPTMYVLQLKQIFNNGVTLWHNYDNYGNYNLSNN